MQLIKFKLIKLEINRWIELENFNPSASKFSTRLNTVLNCLNSLSYSNLITATAGLRHWALVIKLVTGCYCQPTQVACEYRCAVVDYIVSLFIDRWVMLLMSTLNHLPVSSTSLCLSLLNAYLLCCYFRYFYNILFYLYLGIIITNYFMTHFAI